MGRKKPVHKHVKNPDTEPRDRLTQTREWSYSDTQNSYVRLLTQFRINPLWEPEFPASGNDAAQPLLTK